MLFPGQNRGKTKSSPSISETHRTELFLKHFQARGEAEPRKLSLNIIGHVSSLHLKGENSGPDGHFSIELLLLSTPITAHGRKGKEGSKERVFPGEAATALEPCRACLCFDPSSSASHRRLQPEKNPPKQPEPQWALLPSEGRPEERGRAWCSLCFSVP